MIIYWHITYKKRNIFDRLAYQAGVKMQRRNSKEKQMNMKNVYLRQLEKIPLEKRKKKFRYSHDTITHVT